MCRANIRCERQLHGRIYVQSVKTMSSVFQTSMVVYIHMSQVLYQKRGVDFCGIGSVFRGVR
jgi:hypothetical protein